MKPLGPLLAGALAVVLLAGCGSERESERPDASDTRYAGKPLRMDGLMLPARVRGREVELATPEGFQARFWPGVNLGATVPGTLPGEVAAGRADYERWLPEIARLGARVVRVYTILRPDFYDALRAYNLAYPEAPLYVLHGIWIPEEEFLARRDAYHPAVSEAFRREIADAVAVVHGQADLPLRRGHAGGRYRSSIAPWLLGWSLGVEWDPPATVTSDRKNAGAPAHAGRFVRSRPGSTPMESWIASMLDHLAELEAERGWSRPLTFTNWVTTDPLEHPNEPLRHEDLVSVDATHLSATERWPGGFFASYHVYPYYPDFVRYEPGLVSYRRPWDGKADPYASYLHALRRHDGDQALMVTEFGVPTSLGLAHSAP